MNLMSDSELKIHHHPFFAGLEPAAMSGLQKDFQHRKYAGGETLFVRGDRADGVHWVVSGTVRLSILNQKGDELTFELARRGSVFGEIAALDMQTRSASAVAISDAETVFLATNRLKALIGERPEIAMGVIRFLCDRVRKVSDHFESISLFTLEARLANFLLNEARLHNSDQFSLGITQSELAMLLGATRQRVNMAFRALEGGGAITRKGDALHCQLEMLKSIAQTE